MRPWGTKRLFRFTSRTRDEIRADIDDEVAFHLAMRTEDLRREGLPPEQAHAQAMREFGDRVAHDATCRVLGDTVERRGRLHRLRTTA